ncbi:MAG: hypothetical protein JWM11_4686 [Planctomycetaceae bacterium]|nr:hypothetical protein [Planctomycetaceae bacterium]
MADTQRRLILGNGQQYIQSIEKPGFGRSPEPPRTYEAARTLVKNGIGIALAKFESLPAEKKLPEEAVFCLRLHPDSTAKSYAPVTLFQDVPELRNIGSRSYRTNVDEVAQTERIEKKRAKSVEEVSARLVFVQSSPEGFERFLRQLDRPTNQLSKSFQEEIRRVERFDTLEIGEQIVGFTKEWQEGRVELVMHSTRASVQRQRQFLFELFEESGVNNDTSSIREYPGGPTFVSCRLTRSSLDSLAGANPLRTAHPLSFGCLTDLRSAPMADAPKPPTSSTRSTIKVGMFDGGVDPTVASLRGHVEEDLGLAISTPPQSGCVAHGTAVAGTLLHGALNGLKAGDRLPTPPVYVVSIRALPTSNSHPDDPYGWDLYESIDVIERAVPARKDIRVYNISFGPRGPIADDTISRFTYVLDSLAHTHKVAFFVAVGNDGSVAGMNRLQSPSDLVHGIGVGAFTRSGEDVIHASYSCRGPGRECGKLKPDIAAFGGCEDHPMHVVSTFPGKKQLTWGTSFATPIATRLGAQASECFERSSALLARALMIHTAEHPNDRPDNLLGHGCVPQSIDDMLFCDERSVTVVFQGDILPEKIVSLPIPWPSGRVIPGKVKVTWTIAALPPVDLNHPSDYTSCCLEETLYPHCRKYNFTPDKSVGGKPKHLHLDNDASEIRTLLARNWRQSSFPVTESGNKYKDEETRRAIDCKWEPVVRRTVSKIAKNFFDPFMTVHAIGRNGATDRFDYAVIVTLRAEQFDGDLYAEIRNKYPALAPIRLRTEAEIRVQI